MQEIFILRRLSFQSPPSQKSWVQKSQAMHAANKIMELGIRLRVSLQAEVCGLILIALCPCDSETHYKCSDINTGSHNNSDPRPHGCDSP